MNWLPRVTWTAAALAFVSGIACYEYASRPRPEAAAPQELYSVVQRHLAACRSADFSLAYHAAANEVQERLTLVEFERKLRRESLPFVTARQVEYGAVRHLRNAPDCALVDVYFISTEGEASGWTYTLLYEDGDWKIDHGAPIAGWPAGERLSGMRL